MRRNPHKATFGKIFNPILEIPIGCLLFEKKFWWHVNKKLNILLPVVVGYWMLQASNFGTQRDKKQYGAGHQIATVPHFLVSNFLYICAKKIFHCEMMKQRD